MRDRSRACPACRAASRAASRLPLRALAPVLAALAAGCGGGVTLDLPPWPAGSSAALVVEAASVGRVAEEWCDDGGQGGMPAFFFDRLPAEAFAGLCDVQAPSEVADRLGRIFLSGWYGGLWFRDHADFGMGPGGPAEGPVTEADVLALADAADALQRLARLGTPDQVQAANRLGLLGPAQDLESMMESMLTVFAYNWGYVQAVLAKAPAGTPARPFPCAAFLDCDAAGTPLAAFDRFRSVLPRLQDPPDARWQEMADEVFAREPFVDIGRTLWDQGSIDDGSWATLVRINEGYLRVLASASLAAMAGYADRDDAAGRCALLLQAGADTWNGAYFLALRSDVRAGVQPGIDCH